MPSNRPSVCVKDRVVTRGNDVSLCPTCGGEMVIQTSSWRAPKKNNDAAWRKIENGQWLWDERAMRGRWLGRPGGGYTEKARYANPKYLRSKIGDLLEIAYRRRRYHP